jgi:hypothetical protein
MVAARGGCHRARTDSRLVVLKPRLMRVETAAAGRDDDCLLADKFSTEIRECLELRWADEREITRVTALNTDASSPK